MLQRWFRETDRLLILRGLAALNVIAYHAQDAYRRILHPITIFGQDFSWLAWANGGMAVRIFFTLSGFLMFKAFYTRRYLLDRTGITRFYRSRLRRIVPLYYFLTIVFVLLVFPGLLAPAHWRIILSLLTFTYSGVSSPSFASAFWSLSVEMEFYLLVPLIIYASFRLIRRRLHVWAALIVVVAFGIFARSLTIGQPVSAWINFVANLDSFLIGGLACVWLYGPGHRPLSGRVARRRYAVAAAGLGAMVLPIMSLYAYQFPKLGYGLFAPALAALLTAGFIWASEHIQAHEYVKPVYRLREVWSRPALWPAYIGALSYGIYLWHMPILMQVQNAGLVPRASWLTMAFELLITVVLVIICAIWTHHYIESERSR